MLTTTPRSKSFSRMNEMPDPQVTSRFPDCVVMKLHVKVCADDSTLSPLFGVAQPAVATHLKELDLMLTINFSGEQEIEVPGGKPLGLPGGRARFGIRRGQLRFDFQNCKLPLEKTALLQPFKVSIPVEQQKSKSSEIQLGLTASPEGLISVNVGPKIARSSAEKVTTEVFQVKKSGSEDNPSWIFEAIDHDARRILEGALVETPLGVLHLLERSCGLKADFTVRGEDVKITWGQIGQASNINRNKLAVIERAIALRYIKPMVEASPLCEGRWRHG